MGLLSVAEAMVHVTADVEPLETERVSLDDAHGRVLASDVAARLTQPPFNASAMDGYAVRSADLGTLPCTLTVIGEAGAGHAFDGTVGPGQAARIFTGAPVPESADTIVIQEDTTRDGDVVTVLEGAPAGTYIRPRGFDFAEGTVLLPAPRRLTARDVALAAAMNHDTVLVRRRPKVAILATGDELVAPGDDPAPDQIVSSNPYGLAPLVAAFGGVPERLGIARDTLASLDQRMTEAADADILVTIGGASVGEHDLVQDALRARGMSLDFWRIAMRPGKPLMFARKDHQRVLGLPGNPVSAMVCSRIFLVPLLRRLLGLEPEPDATLNGVLDAEIGKNGPRQHYMRATSTPGADGTLRVTPVTSQDSSLLSLLASADCLIVRPPNAPAQPAGDSVPLLRLDF